MHHPRSDHSLILKSYESRYTPSERIMTEWTVRKGEQHARDSVHQSSPHIEHILCVHHLFKEYMCTARMLRCIPIREVRSTEEEPLHTMTLWESTEIEVRLSTARKERRSSTSGSRNQVVARNPLVFYHRDFETAHILNLNLLLPLKITKLKYGINFIGNIFFLTYIILCTN